MILEKLNWESTAVSVKQQMFTSPSDDKRMDFEERGEWAKELYLDESGQITKDVDELSEAELQRIANMGIDIEDVDYVTITKHSFFVATGANQWQQKGLGTKSVNETEMRKLKMEYNQLLAEQRAAKDTQAATALVEKIGNVYEAIVRGGYAISTEESTQGFQGIDLEKDKGKAYVFMESRKSEPAPDDVQKQEFPVLF